MESVAIYCRLSKDDGDDGESNSIKTQKMTMENYCKRQGWAVYDIYVDDGYSGMNFDRPGFQKMYKDVIEAKVNVVISKDLSRLGRNYILTGYYYQVFFPEVGVRYIAVNDHIDTKNENNDIAMAAFKNIMNDLHSKQLSKNIKAARRIMIENKHNCNSKALYGYFFNNDHVLEPVADIVPIIRFIYEEYVSNPNATRIAAILDERKVPTRSAHLLHYAHYQNGKVSTKWHGVAVQNIIRNPAYMGALPVALKKKSSPYQRKYVWIPASEQEIIYDSHEAIVTQALWEKANALRMQVGMKQSGYKSPVREFFAGKVFCAHCGKPLSVYTKSNHALLTCRCWPPGKTTSYKCVNTNILIYRLKSEIKKIALICEEDEHEAYSYILGHLMADRDISRIEIEIEINKTQNRIDVLNDKIPSLDIFYTQTKQKDTILSALELSLKDETAKLNRLMASERILPSGSEIEQFIRSARRFGYINKIERAVLDEIVERIYIAKKTSTNQYQQDRITVKYKYIGMLTGISGYE